MVVTIRAVAVGGPEKWKDPEYILRVELIWFPELTGCVRERYESWMIP